MSFGMAGMAGSLSISTLYHSAKDAGHIGFGLFQWFSYVAAGLSLFSTLGFAVILPRLNKRKQGASLR